MTLNVDYYTSLSRAVDRLGSNTYEARHAIYERARSDLQNRLLQDGGKYSDIEIAEMQSALHEAIRRVEADWQQTPLAPRRPFPRESTTDRTSRVQQGRRRRRLIFRTVAARLAIAAVLLGTGIIAYSFLTGQAEFAWFKKWLSDRIPSSGSKHVDAGRSAAAERAALYKEDPADPIGKRLIGKAIWQTHLETSGTTRTATFVMTVEVEVPEEDLVLTMSMRRSLDEGTALSHLIEFRFAGSNKQPFEAIASVLGILMKNEERSGGEELAGRVVNVASGVFLLGLSGASSDLQRNLRLLRERDWLDIPLVYKNGARSILAVEKGAGGKRAVNEALTEWGQI